MMINMSHKIFIIIIGIFTLASCSDDHEQTPSSENLVQQIADHVFLDGYVYTADANQTIAQAIATKDNKIIFLGKNESANKYIGKITTVHHLDGKMIMPGLHDAHIHSLDIIDIDTCDLQSEPVSLNDMVPLLKDCIERDQLASGEWLIVAQWSFSLGNSPSKKFPTIRIALDAVSEEHPIILLGNDGHHSALNSAALALARDLQGNIQGLSKDTLITHFANCNKLIGVDRNGEPNGSVDEKARYLFGLSVAEVWGMRPMTDDSMLRVAELLSKSGITSIVDAAVFPEWLKFYDDYFGNHAPSYRLTAALFQDPNTCLTDNLDEINIEGIINDLAEVREKYSRHPFINADLAKVFVDGVSEGNPLANPPTLPNAASLIEYKQPMFNIDLENETAEITGYVNTDSDICNKVRSDPAVYADLTTFVDKFGHLPAQCNKSKGTFENSAAFIERYMTELNKQGFRIHAHTVGDRAARKALDIFSSFGTEEEVKNKRFSLAHAQYIHPDDIKRIGDLGISIAFTYAWSEPYLQYDLSTIPFIDEVNGIEDLYNENHYSIKYYYPANSVKLAGGYLTAGSDAPVDTRDPRPFANMQIAITRATPEGQIMAPQERVSIHDVISAYTINGARAIVQDHLFGSIEVGKYADLIIIDQNIVELAESGQANRIAETKVDLTMFDGNIVYTK